MRCARRAAGRCEQPWAHTALTSASRSAADTDLPVSCCAGTELGHGKHWTFWEAWPPRHTAESALVRSRCYSTRNETLARETTYFHDYSCITLCTWNSEHLNVQLSVWMLVETREHFRSVKIILGKRGSLNQTFRGKKCKSQKHDFHNATSSQKLLFLYATNQIYIQYQSNNLYFHVFLVTCLRKLNFNQQ